MGLKKDSEENTRKKKKKLLIATIAVKKDFISNHESSTSVADFTVKDTKINSLYKFEK